jgi:hypothetical protein
MELTARNTDLQSLVTMLKEQDAHKADAIVPATALTVQDDGTATVAGTKPLELTAARVDDNGVTPATFLDMNGDYTLTETGLRHLAERFGVPTAYARKMAAQRPDILASNLNGWIHGVKAPKLGPLDVDMYDVDPDDRAFTLRTFQTREGNLLRGVMSDKYSIIDNLDVASAVFEGIRAAGFSQEDLNISGCDLTENRMRVRVTVPAAQVAAPLLFAGYRNPFQGRDIRVGGRGGWTIEQAREAAAREGQGYTPGTEPIMFAGFEFGNGELGDGATYVVPRAEAEICGNGLVLPMDVARKTHVGERLEEGVINWSAETRRKQLELITSKVADAVRRFASVEFWAEKVAELEEKAATPVTDADKTIKAVGKSLRLSEPEQASVLDMFIAGGQLTSGGVLNAVTAAAQTIGDADRAAEVERVAVKVLDLVR